MTNLARHAAALLARLEAAPYCPERSKAAHAALIRAEERMGAVREFRVMAMAATTNVERLSLALDATHAAARAGELVAQAGKMIESIEADARALREGIPC